MKPLFLFLFLSLLILPAFSLNLKLIRNPFGSDPLQTRLDKIRNMVKHDHARNRFIFDSITLKKNPNCVVPPRLPPAMRSFAMPMNSGAYTGTGQYFVRVRVGTPAQKFLLVADTGSDLTWVNCKYGSNLNKRAGPGGRVRRVFDANKSRTFRPIQCSSAMCKTQLPFSLAKCPIENAPCGYNYGYSDGSTAQGFYANESATITLSSGQKKKLKGLIIGCTSSSVGSSFRSSDGVLGLGYSNISFASHAASRFDGQFSYCLVDHLSPKNVSSYLTFGPNEWLNSSVAHQTQLLIEPTFEPFYMVGITGISIAGKILKIPRSVWDLNKGGGAILDSGTSLTVLVEPAYKAVVSTLSQRLRGIPRVDIDPFSFCYNWTNVGRFEVPKLIIHFNGSRFEPPHKSYLIDVEDGVKCLGFVSTPWPSVSTIGNIIQQEHLWEFDIKNRRVKFQRSSCERYS